MEHLVLPPIKGHRLGFFQRTALDSLLSPKSVAVVGASEREGSVGRTVFWNLISNPFGGTVYPINAKRNNVFGVRAYPSLEALPEPVETVVLAVPANNVPELAESAGKLGARGLIVISAGFKEMGAPGEELERQLLNTARTYGMRIIGPNCLGVMNPLTGFNATFGGVMARPGNIAFISQSGALCTSVLDWAAQEQVGFSAFISVGSMLDVGWGDLIQYLGHDPRTKSIVIYMESVGNARSFLSAAREIALSKPIIVIKAGRTDAAAKAAASHTGALTGSDDVLDAAFRRCGVVRVDHIEDLFYLSEVLAKQPLPRGKRLTIITNAGGPGVLATDELVGHGGELAPLAPATFQAFNEYLPPHWSRNNPVDILGDADAERYGRALQIASQNDQADGTLVILTPQDMTDPTMTAEKLKQYAAGSTKPVLASWMGGAAVRAGNDILSRAGIPTFPYPDAAVRMFNHMWHYESNLRALYETPELSDQADEGIGDTSRVAQLLDQVRAEGRTILTEYESKQVLEAYGIPTVKTVLAPTAEQAVLAAKSIGYPVVIKINSKKITHKTDVGGVVLNLRTDDEVRSAFDKMHGAVVSKFGEVAFEGVTVQPMVKLEGYEVILGASIDPQFGPVLLFGSGGQLVEVYKDSAVALPPLNTTLARRLMERTKIYKALKGVRGRKGVNMFELETLLVRFSQLVVENPWIKECDINPLLVGESSNMIALDGRVVLFDSKTEPSQLPKPSIRPYPRQYVERSMLHDGTPVTVRPIRPEDEALMPAFHATLSERSVVFRYFQAHSFQERIEHDRLRRICFIDYDREMALVAIVRKPDGTRAVAGVIRMQKSFFTSRARFAIVVSDEWQRRGIGSKLLQKLIDVARAEGLSLLRAAFLPDNDEMKAMCEKHNFIIQNSTVDEPAYAELELRPATIVPGVPR
ncbi:MAG: bifunctional acetate--CoA ligase family protein/GNAT family N-acetyltransferase [Polyangiaceae bacterium]